MQNWKFKISGQLLVPGMKNTILNIYPENFKTFNRISDYINKNEPMILAHLTVDKNLFDIMVQNAKVETLYLKVEKFNQEDDMDIPATEIYLEDEFSIILSNDINYNKELDYMDVKDNSLTPDDVKKDVYRDVVIGLMSKKSIDANKVLANNISYESSIQDIVCSYLANLHLLIEPFDHNITKEQLIIPPKSTLTQVIEYLNSVNVFYNTQYLFFIDEPYCTYLISRSGKGIQKKDEKFKDVYINIHKTTDDDMVIQGMYEDNEKGQYRVDVPVVSTKYTVDHDAAKLYDKFEAIINPSKEEGIHLNSDIMKIEDSINKIIGTFREKVQNFTRSVSDIGNRIEGFKDTFKTQVYDNIEPTSQRLNNIANVAIKSQLGSIPSSVSVTQGNATIPVSLIASGFANNAFSSITNSFSNLTSNLNTTKKTCSNFDSLSQKNINDYYKADYLDNYLGSVTFINAQDVIKQTNGIISALNSSSQKTITFNTNSITNQIPKIDNIANQASNITSTLNNVTNTIQTIQSGSNYGLVASQHSGINDTFSMIKSNISKMNNMTNQIKGFCNNLKSLIQTSTDTINTLANFANTIKAFPQALNQIVETDIKSKFCGPVVDFNFKNIESLGTSAVQAFNDINRVLNAGVMSFGALESITNNLDKISSIAGIGKLGISSFETNLQIGGCFGDGKTGSIIIKTKNDNPNQIKNIKSEVETMINQLSISKSGLDPSVFTPNKRFIIKNYDAHSNKDGLFVLNKKTEVYKREDENFTCTTILDFAKLVEQPDSDKVTDNQVNNSDTQTKDWYKQKNGNIINKNQTVNIDKFGNGVLIDKNKIPMMNYIRSNSSIMNFSDTMK